MQQSLVEWFQGLPLEKQESIKRRYGGKKSEQPAAAAPEAAPAAAPEAAPEAAPAAPEAAAPATTDTAPAAAPITEPAPAAPATGH